MSDWREMWEEIRTEDPKVIEQRLAESNPIAYDTAKRIIAHWKQCAKTTTNR